MKQGDLIFYKRANLISYVVAFVTRSPYSHVALAVSETEVIESNVIVNTWKTNFNTEETVVVKRYENLTSEQQKKIVEYAHSKIGTRYDYFAAVRWFLRIVFKRTQKINESEKRLYCSEMIDRAYKQAGIDLVPDRSTGDVTPGDLYNSVELVEVAE